VLLSTGEREHDVEPLGLEGDEGVRIDLGHGEYIYCLIYISVKSEYDGSNRSCVKGFAGQPGVPWNLEMVARKNKSQNPHLVPP
jgi:hypothetical protein